MNEEELSKKFGRLATRILWQGNYGSKEILRIKTPHKISVWAYFAGLFDGEGCIHYKDRGSEGIRLQISIGNTNKEVIGWLLNTFGGHFGFQERHKKNSHHKDFYVWRVNRIIDILVLLLWVEPFLIIKKKKARETIDALQERYPFLNPQRE